MNKTGIIIQARLGSERLPNKILLGLNGKPMLEHVIHRCQATGIETYVAAADNHAFVVRLCQNNWVPIYIGSHFDVLDRIYQCAKLYKLDTVVRITADCPLLDPVLVQRLVAMYEGCAPWTDICSIAAGEGAAMLGEEKMYPDGLDAEVIPFPTLETLHKTLLTGHYREHPTLWIHSHPESYTFKFLPNTRSQGHWKLSVDTEEELATMNRIFAEYGDGVTWRQAITFLRKEQT